MKKRIARLIAGLALTALAATGLTLIDNLVATPDDTAWGAPATDGTGDAAGAVSAETNVTTTAITPLDTAWG